MIFLSSYLDLKILKFPISHTGLESRVYGVKSVSHAHHVRNLSTVFRFNLFITSFHIFRWRLVQWVVLILIFWIGVLSVRTHTLIGQPCDSPSGMAVLNHPFFLAVGECYGSSLFFALAKAPWYKSVPLHKLLIWNINRQGFKQIQKTW